MIENDFWRYVSSYCSIALVCVFAFRVAFFRTSQIRKRDLLRTVCRVAIFCVISYAGFKALHLDLPPRDYNFYLAAAQLIYLASYLIPGAYDAVRTKSIKPDSRRTNSEKLES